MNKRTIVTVGVIAALVAAAGGGYVYSVMTRTTSVTTATASTQTLSVTVSASGKVVATKEVGVFPKVSGTVISVKVADGDTVKAGQTLAVLSPAPLRLQVAQAKSAVSTARAQLAAIDRGLPTSLDRSAASAAVSAARSALSTAKKNYEDFADEMEDLTHDEREAALPQLRQLRTARNQANATLLAARATVGQLSQASRVALDRTAAAQAVVAAEKALAQARADLGQTRVRAPISGVVEVNGTVGKGTAISPAVPPFTITDLNRVAFDASVNESDIASVNRRQPTVVTLDAFLATTFPGKVARVRTTAVETVTGGIAFPVRISLDPAGSRLFVGMTGSADIEVTSIPDALTVPVEAVLTEGPVRSVFVLGADGKAHKTAIQIGAANDTHAQVLSGLDAGAVVVTSQLTALTDGQSVTSL